MIWVVPFLIFLFIKSETMNKKITFKFFTNNHGFSKGKYKSLNCGLNSKDNPNHIQSNILKAVNQISKTSKHLVLPNQSHSNKCIIVSKVQKDYVCDAIVTNSSKFILGITTADCLPIIFHDEKKRNIGVCHAGWKGLINGIIENTINKMNYLGSNNRQITAVIGPCIRKMSYEVSENFVKDLPNNYQQFGSLFNSKYYFDLPKLASYILFNQGIGDIKDVRKNTFKDRNYFSYRESKKKRWSDYGRNISMITIN